MTTFKEVAHLYIGCYFRVERTGQIAPFQFYYNGGDEPIGTHELCKADYSFDEVKPILRKLNSMTDEEREANDKQGSIGWHSITKGEPASAVNEVSQLGLAVVHRQAREMAHLLSLHFDLFNLIDNGFAIDRATLSTNAIDNIEAGKSTVI